MGRKFDARGRPGRAWRLAQDATGPRSYCPALPWPATTQHCCSQVNENKKRPESVTYIREMAKSAP